MPQVRDEIISVIGKVFLTMGHPQLLVNKLLLMMGLLLCTRGAIVSCLQGVLVLIGPTQPVDVSLGRVVPYDGKNLILFLY